MYAHFKSLLSNIISDLIAGGISFRHKIESRTKPQFPFNLNQLPASVTAGGAFDIMCQHERKALFFGPLLNSVAVGICVTVIGISIGTALAWLLVRTNVPFKGFFGTMAVVPYMMPS